MTGVQAHPQVAARPNTAKSKRGQRWEWERTHTSLPQTRHPPDPSVDSDRSASTPTHHCHRLDTARETCTVTGVRAHPHVAATNSSPPQIQVWTATGVRAHPLIATTDSTPPDKHAQRRECKRTHTSLPQTRHPPDPSMDSDGSASAPTHCCH